MGKDKRGRSWQRKRVTVFQIEVAELLLAGVRRGDLASAEAEVDGIRTTKRKATARRVIAGKNKGKPLSEQQKAKLSEIASKRVGEANPFYGKTHTKETKAKLSAAARARTGWHHTPETRRKMANSQKGRVFSEEHRKKLSAAHRGKVLGAETRAKIAAALTGEKNPNYGKPMFEEQRAKIRAAKLGQRPSREVRERLSAAQTGRMHPEEVKDRISVGNVKALKSRRGYRLVVLAGKFPGGIVGCRGVLEEAAVRIIQANPMITEAYYEELIVPYTDDNGRPRHAVPDYKLVYDGETMVVEVSASGQISPPMMRYRHQRTMALMDLCEESGYQLVVWNRRFIVQTLKDFQLRPVLRDLSMSRIRASVR